MWRHLKWRKYFQRIYLIKGNIYMHMVILQLNCKNINKSMIIKSHFCCRTDTQMANRSVKNAQHHLSWGNTIKTMKGYQFILVGIQILRRVGQTVEQKETLYSFSKNVNVWLCKCKEISKNNQKIILPQFKKYVFMYISHTENNYII